MNSEEIVNKLKSLQNPKNKEGMARFGINPKYCLGISIPILRQMAKEIKKEYKNKEKDLHSLAVKLWKTKIHEAKLLSSMIDVPKLVTDKQMNNMILDFDSWDICDQTCMNLFCKTNNPFKKALSWTKNKGEFQLRAAFALMACLAWQRKDEVDEKLLKFFPYIKKYSTDERNYVKKAVNWALRQIGKRKGSKILKKEALRCAKEIIKDNPNSKSATWIAKDAIRELSKHN